MRRHRPSSGRRTVLRSLGGPALLLAVCPAIAACARAETAPDATPTRVVCLHSTGETYQAFAWLLCSHLATELGDRYAIDVTASLEPGYSLTGAMDILESIAASPVEDGVYYLGLTQTDVAHAFLEGGHALYELPHLRRNNVVTIAHALPEYLHVYSSLRPEQLEPVNGSTPLEPNFDQYEAAWDELYLGPLGSGTLLTAVRLFPILSERSLDSPRTGLRQERAGFAARRPRAPRPEAESNLPWGGFLVAGAPVREIAARLVAGEGALVSLKPEQQRHLITVYSRLYRSHTLHYAAPGGGELAVTSVEIPALLVAPKATPEEIVLEIRRLFSQIGDLEDAGGESARRLLERLERGGITKPENVVSDSPFHVLDAIRRYHHRRSDIATISQYLSPVLPIHRSVMELPGWNFLLPAGIATVCLVLLVFFGRRAFAKLHAREESTSLFDLNPSLVLACASLGFVLWSHVCIALVVALERRDFMNYRTRDASLLVTEPILDNYLLILRNLVSGLADERLFPTGPLARFLLLTVPFFLVIAAVVSVVQLVVPPAVKHLAKKLRRSRPMKLQDHTLLCHWHRHAPHVIQMLQDHARLEERDREEIVVLAPDRSQIRVPEIGEHVDEGVGRYFTHAVPPAAAAAEQSFSEFSVIEGDPSQETALRLARATRARAVILFPHPDHPEPDSETLLTALTLRRLIGVESQTATDDAPYRPPRVIAWCVDPDHIDTFRQEAFGLSDVCSAEWAWRLLCQATYVDHVSNLYRRLMTSSETTNEVYEMELPESFAPLTFGDVQARALAFNRDQAPTLGFEADVGAQEDGSPVRVGKRNTVVPIGFARATDPTKDDLQLNPNPEAIVGPGCRLLFLAFRLDPGTRSALLGVLQDEAASAA